MGPVRGWRSLRLEEYASAVKTCDMAKCGQRASAGSWQRQGAARGGGRGVIIAPAAAYAPAAAPSLARTAAEELPQN
jgi:hypothetical protein